MKIEVQKLPEQGITLGLKRNAHTFGALNELVAAEEVDFASPVEISLRIWPEKDMIKVTGHVAFTLRVACSRCLSIFEKTLSQRFTLRFSRRIPQDVHPGDLGDLGDPGGDIEWTADQIGLNFFEGDTIDLTDTVQEQIILALPFKFVCREDCKGLCPHCGADLNRETCQCDGREISGSFDVLKSLKSKLS